MRGHLMCVHPCVWLIAKRYLRPKRREGFVSVITGFSVVGIMLGVATLILVTSLMNGIREEMLRVFSGVEGHIKVYGASAPLPDDDDSVTFALKDEPSVKKIYGKIEGQVMVTASGTAQGAQVMAWQLNAPQNDAWLKQHFPDNALQALARNEGVVLGERLAKNLRVGVGDSITLISPQGRTTFAGFVPRMKSYVVTGTFSLGMHLYDSSLIVMPHTQAQLYFNLMAAGAPRHHYDEVVLKNADDAQRVAALLREKLRADYRVYDWQQTNQSIFAALNVQRNVMVIILALIIVVAAFNIISSLIMLVQDKSGDIAILRTLGAQRAQIMAIFCINGTLTGLVGTLLGLGLGLLLANNLEAIKQGVEVLIGQEILVDQIYFLSTLPTKIEPSQVIVIVLMSMVLSLVATIYPAWRASTIQPAEALRYE